MRIRCSQCRKLKRKDEFFKDSRVSSGLHSECKECTKATKKKVGQTKDFVYKAICAELLLLTLGRDETEKQRAQKGNEI